MLDTAISRTLAMERLRIYERECRRQAQLAEEGETRTELTKFADAFQAAMDRHTNATVAR